MSRLVKASKWTRSFRSIVSVLLILALMLSLAGCKDDNEGLDRLIPDAIRSWGDVQGNNDLFSAHELVQKVADAVRNGNDTEMAYKSIPAKQLDGVTLDQFQQYITFLRRGVAGDVTSFAQMSEEEVAEIRAKILERLPEQQALVDGLQGFWLYYQVVGRIEEKFGIFVQAPAEGVPSLSGEWIRKILDFKDFSGLYFNAIYTSDEDTMTVLYEPVGLSKDILYLRAERIIDFYQNNISTRSIDFRLAYARIDGIAFEEYGITNPDKTQSSSRTLELIGMPDGSIRIFDILPEVINTKDLQVYFNDKYLLKLGEYDDGEPVRIRSSELESIIGAPVLHDDTTCTTATNGSQRLELQYDGLLLSADGSCFRHSRWNGQITGIILQSDAYRLGSGLSSGVSEEDILRLYPFINETDYTLNGFSDGGPVQVRFIREAGIMTAIELMLNPS